METPTIQDTALLVKIEHSKPIPVKDFASTIEAYGNLYATYLKGQDLEFNQESTGLYIEKIENNCILVYLRELIDSSILPFAENVNTILGFAGYLKTATDFFIKGIKPDNTRKYSISELKAMKEIFSIPANDTEGKTSIGPININNPTMILGDVIKVNYEESNTAQNKINQQIETLKAQSPNSGAIYSRVLMAINNHRIDNTGKGNRAIIDEIIKGKAINLLFATDELRNSILMSDENPAKKAYQVDVEVQTINDKVVAYKVIALHDIIDIDDM